MRLIAINDIISSVSILSNPRAPSIRINKVNRIIGTIGIWRDIIVLFCKRVLLEEDGGGRVVEPCAEVEEGLVGVVTLCQ